MAQLRRPAQQVDGQRQVGVGPGAARPTFVGARQPMAQERPPADQPLAAGRAAPQPDDGGLGIVAQSAAELGRRELLILLPVGEPGGVHPGIVLDDPLDEHFAPPGPQGHLADQLALDRVLRPELAGELGLAAVTSAAASGGRTIPLPVSPSLQPFCRLRSLPSCVVGPFDRRPLDLLASARAVLGPASVLVMASIGSASAAIIGGASSEVKRSWCRTLGPSPPRFRTPASSPNYAILNP